MITLNPKGYKNRSNKYSNILKFLNEIYSNSNIYIEYINNFKVIFILGEDGDEDADKFILRENNISRIDKYGNIRGILNLCIYDNGFLYHSKDLKIAADIVIKKLDKTTQYYTEECSLFSSFRRKRTIENLLK